jgi:hypothetical protein
MFDNLRDYDPSFYEEGPDEPSQPPVKKKKVLRFRWPIHNILKWSPQYPDDDPLQERLLEFMERGEVTPLEELEVEDLHRGRAYLVRVFVEDADGRKYVAPIPQSLKDFNRELRKKNRP